MHAKHVYTCLYTEHAGGSLLAECSLGNACEYRNAHLALASVKAALIFTWVWLRLSCGAVTNYGKRTLNEEAEQSFSNLNYSYKNGKTENMAYKTGLHAD